MGNLNLFFMITHKCTQNVQPKTHTNTFNGPLSGTTQVSRYQKGKTNLDFTEARDSEWQWHHKKPESNQHTNLRAAHYYR